MIKRNFKKYDNRKLYDLDHGFYVSMSNMVTIIKAEKLKPETISIRDDRTSKDLTLEVLGRLVYDQCRIRNRQKGTLTSVLTTELRSDLVRLIQKF